MCAKIDALNLEVSPRAPAPIFESRPELIECRIYGESPTACSNPRLVRQYSTTVSVLVNPPSWPKDPISKRWETSRAHFGNGASASAPSLHLGHSNDSQIITQHYTCTIPLLYRPARQDIICIESWIGSWICFQGNDVVVYVYGMV